MTDTSPTRLERLAQNFRNSNNVVDYELDADDDRLTVTFEQRGYNFTNLRTEKGFEFTIDDIFTTDDGPIVVSLSLGQ